jgi:hypothetical protein
MVWYFLKHRNNSTFTFTEDNVWCKVHLILYLEICIEQ